MCPEIPPNKTKKKKKKKKNALLKQQARRGFIKLSIPTASWEMKNLYPSMMTE